VAVQEALSRELEAMRHTVGGDAGFICVGRDGSIGIDHRTRHMAAAWWTSEHGSVTAMMARE
jgi:isoaspartyl peptidase/L-asparaginase-like protein (Ntn-hydrolase superfamily)